MGAASTRERVRAGWPRRGVLCWADHHRARDGAPCSVERPDMQSSAPATANHILKKDRHAGRRLPCLCFAVATFPAWKRTASTPPHPSSSQPHAMPALLTPLIPPRRRLPRNAAPRPLPPSAGGAPAHPGGPAGARQLQGDGHAGPPGRASSGRHAGPGPDAVAAGVGLAAGVRGPAGGCVPRTHLRAAAEAPRAAAGRAGQVRDIPWRLPLFKITVLLLLWGMLVA